MSSTEVSCNDPEVDFQGKRSWIPDGSSAVLNWTFADNLRISVIPGTTCRDQATTDRASQTSETENYAVVFLEYRPRRTQGELKPLMEKKIISTVLRLFTSARIHI